MESELSTKLKLSPAIWPGGELRVQPGDLTRCVPQGLGLSIPLIVRPWDDPIEVLSGRANRDFYGFQPHTGNPFFDAPINTESGGTIYFDRSVELADVAATGRLMGVRDRETRFAAFLDTAKDPATQRYLMQMRLVPHGALRNLFDIPLTDEEMAAEQPLSIGEALAAFIEDQRKIFDYGNQSFLAGSLGGDGDWAYESLAFGLLVENDYHGICRIWSRAWLVTK